MRLLKSRASIASSRRFEGDRAAEVRRPRRNLAPLAAGLGERAGDSPLFLPRPILAHQERHLAAIGGDEAEINEIGLGAGGDIGRKRNHDESTLAALGHGDVATIAPRRAGLVGGSRRLRGQGGGGQQQRRRNAKRAHAAASSCFTKRW